MLYCKRTKDRFGYVFMLNVLHVLPSYCDLMFEKQEKFLINDKETYIYSTKRLISSWFDWLK